MTRTLFDAQGESITRDAARAIGKSLTNYRWDKRIRGMLCGDDPSILGSQFEVFAPLSEPSDAYIVEDILQMHVQYKRNLNETSIQVQCTRHNGSIFHTVSNGETTLFARMYAITQFAALCATMDMIEIEGEVTNGP